ncbi:mannose-1-phosphate guanylyltransferase [Paenibacillus sp. UNCCL117]|uniref:sugar phosphate nucleotidyltransferase n=1 Tax=unclassified Paenibacillus TaxID=185978 RepID=UPI00088597BC|nr:MULTISPECIES: sugar phosphate nucleotidyltransferase [unclassified Paenibacillus]SDD11469.1 mannose-1-phosphate guanylyltransferase [Paenibacillus sp. cl123]SFW33580.1 mannose-1-phosphate guanylyltransferase [Paenibacillus sp. UNCCL117]
MRIVLLSGGSGKRLWPLSNEVRSKAFLKLLPADGGVLESMIQRVCRQLEAAGLLAATSIVAHRSQLDLIRNHVGEQLPIIAEPHKRGTFTAIALASAYWHAERGADEGETICVLPVDSFADPDFFRQLQAFPAVLAESGADLALLGTVPAFPSDQFGYMVPAAQPDQERGWFSVARFVEKPDERQATELVRANALWNCGVFAFRLGFMLAELERRAWPADRRQLLELYEQLTELSFDREVAERSRKAVAIPYRGRWNDLGSWEALTQQLDSQVIGSGQISQDSVNTHLINELGYPIHVIDMSDAIVAASSDGILVASKRGSSRIKERLAGAPQMARYEETRWGTSRVLDMTGEDPGTQVITNKLELLPGKHTGYRRHAGHKEIWTIVSGTGELALDGQLQRIASGDVLQIVRGAKHALRAITQLEVIQIIVITHGGAEAAGGFGDEAGNGAGNQAGGKAGESSGDKAESKIGGGTGQEPALKTCENSAVPSPDCGEPDACRPAMTWEETLRLCGIPDSASSD